MASSVSFWERIGLRSAGGVGDAGWGRTLVVAAVSFIYFLPVLFIIFTAIKPQALALSVPPTLSPTSKQHASWPRHSSPDKQNGGLRTRRFNTEFAQRLAAVVLGNAFARRCIPVIAFGLVAFRLGRGRLRVGICGSDQSDGRSQHHQ